MADLSISLELEFRLLESHIIKKQIRDFRQKRPDIPQYQDVINKEIRKDEIKDLFFKIIFYGGLSTFVLAIVGLLTYIFLYTDLVPMKNTEKESKFDYYPKYVECVDSMKIDNPKFSLDLLLTIDSTIVSICERSLNYATVEDLKETPITDNQILDNCYYNKIEKNKNSPLIEEKSSNFFSQCVKTSEGKSQFTDFFYRDYSNKRFRKFIESWKNTKKFNSMT